MASNSELNGSPVPASTNCRSVDEEGRGGVDLSWKRRLPLVSILPFTLQDFPGKPACVLWFTGCQMRCQYCHNPDFANGEGESIDVENTFDFLKRRKRLIEGVVFSGGECLLSSAVVPMVRAVKELGFLVKIDTNGGNPERLRALLEEGLIDFVAMDLKAPFEKYGEVTGWSEVTRWEESFRLLRESKVGFEIRTTVHPDLIDEEEVDSLMDYLELSEYSGTYYIQHYNDMGNTLGKLGAPSRRFDLKLLNLKRRFDVQFRNFTANELSKVNLRSQ